MTDRPPRFTLCRAMTAAALLSCALPRPALSQALTLSEALDSALASHPSVVAARARVDGARAAVSAARAQWVPTLAGSAGLTRFQEPMVVAPLHGFDPTHPPAFDRTLIQGQLGLQYTLFDGGARGARIRVAGAGEAEAIASRDGTRMQVLESVTQAYLAALAAHDVLDAANRQVAALEAEHDRASQNLEQGTAARVEVLRAEAALMDARAQAASAESGARLSRNDLARLMGVDPTWIGDRTLVDVAAIQAPEPSAGAESPEVERARRAVDAAQARVSQETANRLPMFQASAALVDYAAATGSPVTEWQAGLKVSWPLFTGGARRAAIRQARAGVRSAQASLHLAELQNQQAIDAADAAVVEADARTEALQASVRQWQEVARIEALSLTEGSGVQSDLLRAQAGLFQARAGYARARYDAVLARVRLARAQGSLDRKWMDTALEAR